MAQYPLPQFIEEENKITFFLTFRQFFLLVGGAVICFVLYYTLPFAFFIPLALLAMLIIGVIAFVKIDDESIIKIIFHFFNFYTDNKNYTWRKGDMPSLTNQPTNQTETADTKEQVSSQSEDNKEGYTYLKYNSARAVSNSTTDTQSSKLNSARKAVEFKGK